MKTFFHPAQLDHHPRSYFSRGQMRSPQEVPDRARRILAAVQQMGFEVLEPADHGDKPLSAVHTPQFLEFLRTAHARWTQTNPDWGDEVMSNIFVRSARPPQGMLAEAAWYLADGSCPVGEHTWNASYWSAQSAVAAARAVIDGERSVYALCRPPGHHARPDAAGGFCYLNNAAIAAQELRARFDTVTVLDTDVHHGQGIQETFYERPDVQYVSTHASPVDFYPAVVGFAEETGAGKGAGFNLNLPMPIGSPESVFFETLERALAAVRAYKPQALVLALGFDVYKDDPQAAAGVSTEGFARLGRAIRALDLPTVIVQEGGYNLGMLEANTQSFFRGFEGRD
jgi:acetoin utilization deacetylase AcuC-like enzyme